jgi:hypothetical protein
MNRPSDDQPLDRPGDDVTLLQAESAVSYASGHLIFADDETLMAQPFDLDTRQLRGEDTSRALRQRALRETSRGRSRHGFLHWGQAPRASASVTTS